VKNIYNLILIFYTIIIFGCSEKTLYTGKIYNNLNNDIHNLKTKSEIINYIGYPNYIDPIENKYFYYSEKKIIRNFFDNKTIYKKLIVFDFNADNTIKLINEYNLDNENDIKLVKDQTSNEIIGQGLLEKIFGGVGTSTLPTN